MMNQRRVFVPSKRSGLVLVALCLVLLPALKALALEIIFDPGNFAKNVQQVAALFQQIERATTEILLQERMLAHLPATFREALALSGQALDAQLAQSFPDVRTNASDVGERLEAEYPIEFPQAPPGWLATMDPLWLMKHRAMVLHERDLTQHVHEQMTSTTQQLTALIEASNGVDAENDELPGVVAVAQAHEELLALCSVEADKLIAIRAARAKRHVERRANQQAESAYHAARRDALMKDWPKGEPGKSKPIRFPF